MTSRERILDRVRRNQPPHEEVNAIEWRALTFSNPQQKFEETLASIGGKLLMIDRPEDIESHLNNSFLSTANRISGIPEVIGGRLSDYPHSYCDVLLCILEGALAIAENGAVWIPNKLMPDRVLPFICEHLVLVLKSGNIVNNMSEAYDRIDANYEYGTFIAGPSKTADIEQSLVLGAHGPKSLTVFLLK